jgi:hypothetical protein
VVDRRGAGIKPLESVREEVFQKIDEEKIEKMFEKCLVGIRKRSYIDIKL